MLGLIAQETGDPVMTAAAWTFMAMAWLAVLVLAIWCFRRVLGGGR